MNILLIYPYFIDDRIHSEDIKAVPMGVYYIGALLKENNYNVDILNWYNIDKTPEKIKEVLSEKKPDVIGFTILHANRWGGIEIARLAKEINPEVKTVFGGVGAVFLWEHLLTHFKEVDYIVMGEGEYTFLNLITYFEQGDDDGADIKGIAFRRGKEIIRAEPADKIENLDSLPIPAKYFKFQHLSLTRGCPENCTFCGSPDFWERRVRFHSSDYFVKQLSLLYQKGIRFFYFSDDTFTINKEVVIDICGKIIEQGLDISWAAISHVKYVDEDVLSWMRRAGCIQISYGIESGSEEIRGVFNKKLNNRLIIDTFDLTKKYGIMPRAYFIYGSPGENMDTIKETKKLISSIKPLGAIFYILDIFPGTALYEDYKKRMNVSDDLWLQKVEDIMYFETDPDLNQDMVIAFGRELRTCFYQNLSSYAKDIELTDQEGFHQLHADFLSRLGMTFSHGDYAQVEAITEKNETAEFLYRRALTYHHNHRAYLGLGMLYQQNREFDKGAQILKEGIEHFPDDEQLNMCMGINHMNQKEFETALVYFLKFEESRHMAHYTANCYGAMGEFDKARAIRERFNLNS